MPTLTIKQYFAERLKALRTERDWTLQQLADKIGVSAQMIWIYEQGVSDPPLSRVVQFANVFNVPADTLYPVTASPADLAPVATPEGA